jgi:hypothetical protein
VLGPDVEGCVSGFERLLLLGEDTGRLEMGWETSASFGEKVTPAVELGVLGGSQLRKQNLYRSLKTDFLRSRSHGDLTTYSLNSSTNEKSFIASSTNIFNLSM